MPTLRHPEEVGISSGRVFMKIARCLNGHQATGICFVSLASLSYSTYSLKATTAFCPPKPNPLAIAA